MTVSRTVYANGGRRWPRAPVTLDETAGVLEGLIEPAVSASDRRDLSEDLNPTAAEANERAAAERKAAEEQAFADKLAKRPPPNPVERAEIEKARKANQSPHATYCY